MITAVERKRMNPTTGKTDLGESWAGREGGGAGSLRNVHLSTALKALTLLLFATFFYLPFCSFPFSPPSLSLPRGALMLKILLWVSSVKVVELLHLPGLHLEDGEDTCPRYLTEFLYVKRQTTELLNNANLFFSLHYSVFSAFLFSYI